MSDYIVVKNRRKMCENIRFEVFFDHIEDFNGHVVKDYLVVSPKQKTEKLVTGTAILPVVDDKFLLINIYRHAIGGFSWEIPGGFLEEGEDLSKSALREFEEETGYLCDEGQLQSLGHFTPNTGVLSARIMLFVAMNCHRTSPFLVDELGIKDIKLFSMAEMNRMVMDSAIQDPCTLISFFRYCHQQRSQLSESKG